MFSVALNQFKGQQLIFLWLKQTDSVAVYLLLPQVLLLLQGAEPPMLCSRQKLSRPYTEVTIMTLLTSMADKELVHMIAWAKKLPGAASSCTVAAPPTNILHYFFTGQTLPNYCIISESLTNI